MERRSPWGTIDGTVKLWDVATQTPVVTLEGHTGRVKSVRFSPDGSILASASEDGTVKLWEMATRTNFSTLLGHTAGVESVSFSPDGTTLASGSNDYTVKVWNPETGSNMATFEGHVRWVEVVSFSPDGSTLVSGSSDGTVKLWNVETGNATSIYGHNVGNSVSFSLDGTTLASGSTDETVRLWDIKTGRNIKSFGFQQWGVNVVSFSPDGATLASGSLNNSIILWDMATGGNVSPRFEGSCPSCPEERFFLSRGMGPIYSLGVFTRRRNPRCWGCWKGLPCGTWRKPLTSPLLQEKSVGSIRLRFRRTGRLSHRQEMVGPGAQLWDASTLTHIATLGDNPVNSVAFSPDGTTLASGIPPWYGGRTELWDLATRNKIITHYGCGGCVAFSPDGTLLACHVR